MLCQSLAERLQVTFFFATLEQWRNPQRYLGRWRSNFFPFTVLLNPKPVRMISERSIDSILLHFRMESRFLRLADLVVQRMPWGLEELEESSDYNQFGLRCCGPCITYSSSIAKMSFVLQQQKTPVFVIADQSDSWSFKQKKRLQQPQILKLLFFRNPAAWQRYAFQTSTSGDLRSQLQRMGVDWPKKCGWDIWKTS